MGPAEAAPPQEPSIDLKDPALAENIAETAYKEAVSMYTWDASAGMLFEKYEQLLSLG